MLLHCGHDLCRKCVNFMYKKSKQIICKICHAVTKYESFVLYFMSIVYLIFKCIKCFTVMRRLEHEDHFNNISVHYYLVGKVLYLSSNKKQNMFREMKNLRMTNLSDKPIKKNKS